MLDEIFSQDYYDSLLSEFPQLTIYDLKRCIDISVTEYFVAKHAFIVQDKIYVILNDSIQELQKNSIRTKPLRQIMRKNFRLIDILKKSDIEPRFIKDNNIVLYGKIDALNKEFVLFSLYFNKKTIPKIKMISYKNNTNTIQFNNLSKENIYPVQIDIKDLQSIEDIFIFNGYIMNRNIVIHHLSLIFKKINKSLNKKTNRKLFYTIEGVDYNKNIIRLKLNKQIGYILLNFIKEKVKEKLHLDAIFSNF